MHQELHIHLALPFLVSSRGENRSGDGVVLFLEKIFEIKRHDDADARGREETRQASAFLSFARLSFCEGNSIPNSPQIMNARHVPSDDWSGLLKKEEEALITILKEKALVRCKLAQREYYECVKGRTLSIAWACRESGTKLNECLHEETSEEKLNEAKRKWIKAGKPRVGTENGERIPVTFM